VTDADQALLGKSTVAASALVTASWTTQEISFALSAVLSLVSIIWVLLQIVKFLRDWRWKARKQNAPDTSTKDTL
jgi:hypothetical protein